MPRLLRLVNYCHIYEIKAYEFLHINAAYLPYLETLIM